MFISLTNDAKREYAIRESGSGFDTTSLELEAYGNSMSLVGLNAADQFDAFLEDVDLMKIYLVGQTKGSVIYNLEDVLVTEPTLASWQELDADSYNVPDAANGIFFHIENSDGSDRIVNVVHGDSTDAWTPDVGNDTHIIAGTGISADNIWNEYLENANVDIHIAAYTVPLTN